MRPVGRLISAIGEVSVNILSLKPLCLFVFRHYPYAKPLRTFAGNALNATADRDFIRCDTQSFTIPISTLLRNYRPE